MYPALELLSVLGDCTCRSVCTFASTYLCRVEKLVVTASPTIRSFCDTLASRK